LSRYTPGELRKHRGNGARNAFVTPVRNWRGRNNTYISRHDVFFGLAVSHVRCYPPLYPLTTSVPRVRSEQTDPLQPLPTVFGSRMGNRITQAIYPNYFVGGLCSFTLFSSKSSFSSSLIPLSG